MAGFLSRLTVHERASEAMVGLLVALAARGSAAVTGGDDADPQTLVLVSALATLSWAIVDSFFALLAAKGARLRWAHLTDDRRDPAERGHEWADEALNHTFLSNLEEPALQRIRSQAVKEAGNAKPVSPRLTADDWLTGLAVFTVVAVAGVPAILPFLVLADVQAAAWTSYAIALALMFTLGAHWGPAHGLSRMRAGSAMLGLGAAMVVVLLVLAH